MSAAGVGVLCSALGLAMLLGADGAQTLRFPAQALHGAIVCPAAPAPPTPGCVPGPPAQPGDDRTWNLVFREEFEQPDFDHSKLTPCFDWNYGACTDSFNSGREHYDPTQVRVSEGMAHLVAEPLEPPLPSPPCLDGLCTYASGLLSTARPRADDGSPYLFTFTYGYAEARIRFPALQGFLSAFWLLPAAPDYDYSTEIDVAEILGNDPRTIHMTYHYRDRSRSYTPNSDLRINGSCPGRDYSQGFVKLAVDWSPERIAWFVDDVKCAEFTEADSIGSEPMQLVLNLSVDHEWLRDWSVPLLEPTARASLDVDYIRVFQSKPPGADRTAAPGPTPESTHRPFVHGGMT